MILFANEDACGNAICPPNETLWATCPSVERHEERLADVAVGAGWWMPRSCCICESENLREVSGLGCVASSERLLAVLVATGTGSREDWGVNMFGRGGRGGGLSSTQAVTDPLGDIIPNCKLNGSGVGDISSRVYRHFGAAIYL